MKKLTILAIIALLAVPALGALQGTYSDTVFDFERRIGPERVTNFDPRVNVVSINSWVYLEPLYNDEFEGAGRGGYAPMFPRGTARVKSGTWNGFAESQVLINVKDLPVSSKIGGHFEAWLVDDDTGYRLSMGTFTTIFGGVGQLRYRADNYFGAYDRVEITAEPFNDWDVLPGPALLQGKITKDYFYTPQPKQAKLVSSVIKRI